MADGGSGETGTPTDPGTQRNMENLLHAHIPKPYPTSYWYRLIATTLAFPHMGFWEFEGQVEATYIIEHFVQLLGVHDEVGVAYHVVDSIRLDRRDWRDWSKTVSNDAGQACPSSVRSGSGSMQRRGRVSLPPP